MGWGGVGWAEAPPERLLDEITARHSEPIPKIEYQALEDEFVRAATVEDLSANDRQQYEAVRDNGRGVCSRCRWGYEASCSRCDAVKAWDYCCRNTLYEAMSTVVRPSAKPRGRPKVEAKGKAKGKAKATA